MDVVEDRSDELIVVAHGGGKGCEAVTPVKRPPAYHPRWHGPHHTQAHGFSEELNELHSHTV